MSKNKNRAAEVFDSAAPASLHPSIAPTYQDNWITDRAWICGIAGALTVVACGYGFSQTDALRSGIELFGTRLTDNRIDSSLFALVLCSTAMVLVELVRLAQRSDRPFLRLDPDLRHGHYWRFCLNCLLNYLLYLVLFTLVIAFYQAANEYGFRNNAPYYQPWFRLLDLAWTTYLWAGLPYVLLTRSLHFDPTADQRDPTRLFGRILKSAVAWVPTFAHLRQPFDEQDKKIARGLLVKIFFAPLMTVFFCDQFQHLVSNIGYLLHGLPQALDAGDYTHARFNRDLINISMALIFSIDVALAWCGYVIATRWLDNQTLSAEPTMLGWIVCVVCYPPFQNTLGLYFSIPGDHAILGIANPWLVSIFVVLMVLSYAIYMSATLWFGVRFSNLTHRGIIRTGPFAFVRHPAYASKNFAWWCVMFPYVIYNLPNSGLGAALFNILGLTFMTGFYYLRARTEERHLLADPAYQLYCQQVRYRFIPGVV